MSDTLLGALALLLVFEGLLPFMNPAGWRRAVEQIARLRDGQLRFLGLMCIVAGLFGYWLVT